MAELIKKLFKLHRQKELIKALDKHKKMKDKLEFHRKYINGLIKLYNADYEDELRLID